MKRERDSQKSRVYKTDFILADTTKPLPTVADIEKFVERLFKSKRFANKYPKAFRWGRPRVEPGRWGQRRALGSWRWISIPVRFRNEGIVLHELAHTITLREFGDVAAHGWQFAAVYLDIVKWMLGKAKHDLLKSAFKANKVKFRKPVKRNLTDEQRASLAARLQAGRLKKSQERFNEVHRIIVGA